MIDFKDTMAWVRTGLILILALTLAFNHWLYPLVRSMRRQRKLAEFRAQLYSQGRVNSMSGVAESDNNEDTHSWQRRERADYEAAFLEWRRAQFRAALYEGTALKPSAGAFANSPDIVVGSTAGAGTVVNRSWSEEERKAFIAALQLRERREFLEAASLRSSSSFAALSPVGNVGLNPGDSTPADPELHGTEPILVASLSQGLTDTESASTSRRATVTFQTEIVEEA